MAYPRMFVLRRSGTDAVVEECEGLRVFGSTPRTMITVLTHGLVFLLSEVGEETDLVAFHFDGLRAVVDYRLSVPRDSDLIQSASGSAGAIVVEDVERLIAIPLGPSAADLESSLSRISSSVIGRDLAGPGGHRPLESGTPDDGPDGRREVLLPLIAAADELVGEGNLEAAMKTLDQHVVWAISEPQSLGRLATICLALTASSPEQIFWKRLVLASFVECLDNPHDQQAPIPELGDARWSNADLAALREQAERWLESS